MSVKSRQVKPEFWDHPGLCALGDTARLLYISLWAQADREGRLKYEPDRIATRFNPYRRTRVKDALERLETSGFVTRYPANGGEVMCIPAFRTHQHVHPGEAKSKLPWCGGCRQSPDASGNYRELPVNAGTYTLTYTCTCTDTLTLSDHGEKDASAPPADDGGPPLSPEECIAAVNAQLGAKR